MRGRPARSAEGVFVPFFLGAAPRMSAADGPPLIPVLRAALGGEAG